MVIIRFLLVWLGICFPLWLCLIAGIIGIIGQKLGWIEE